MNIIKSAKISRFLLKSVRDFNEFHTPRVQRREVTSQQEAALEPQVHSAILCTLGFTPHSIEIHVIVSYPSWYRRMDNGIICCKCIMVNIQKMSHGHWRLVLLETAVYVYAI